MQTKQRTFVDRCVCIPISKLIGQGAISKGSTTGTVNWGKSSINYFYCGNVISFVYQVTGVTRVAEFEVEERPTNLGIGTRWFFKCPSTGKLCTKLLITPDGRIVTRSMLEKVVYSYQHYGRNDRMMYQDRRYNVGPFRPYGKTYYNGKITPYGKRVERWDTLSELSAQRWFEWITTRLANL